MFMAVAQAFGSDMGMVMELESIVMLQIPSAREYGSEGRVGIISVTSESYRDKRSFQKKNLVTVKIETEDCFPQSGEPSSPAASFR